MALRLTFAAVIGFALVVSGGCAFDRYVADIVLLDENEAVAPFTGPHGHLMVATDTDRRREDGFEKFAESFRAKGATEDEICFGTGSIGSLLAASIEPPANFSEVEADAWIESDAGIDATLEAWRAEIAHSGAPDLLTNCTLDAIALITPITPEGGSGPPRYRLEFLDMSSTVARYVTFHTLQNENHFILQVIRSDGSAAYEFFAHGEEESWMMVSPESLGQTRFGSTSELFDFANYTFDDQASQRLDIRFEPISQANRNYLEELRARLTAAEAEN